MIDMLPPGTILPDSGETRYFYRKRLSRTSMNRLLGRTLAYIALLWTLNATCSSFSLKIVNIPAAYLLLIGSAVKFDVCQ